MSSPTPNIQGTSAKQFFDKMLEGFDWSKFFEALPTEEFSRILEEQEQRIAIRTREREAVDADLKRLRSQVEMIKQALTIREALIVAREEERKAASRQTTAIPSLAPKRKRAAVLQVLEDHPGELLTPADVRSYLAKAGLIDPENETGTPVRILLAQLVEANVIVRPEPGKYRLKTRAEQENGANVGVQTSYMRSVNDEAARARDDEVD